MKLATLLAGIAAIAIASCSSSPKPAPATGAGGDAPAPAAEAPAADDIGDGVAWADKTHEQKAAFMKAKVVPAVAAIWKDSPEPDEKVTCMTCHGSGAMEGKFDMPTTNVPPLNPADGFAAHAEDAAWLEFMGKKLVPTMVDTLGVDPYDMNTNKGFGCFACHTMEGAAK